MSGIVKYIEAATGKQGLLAAIRGGAWRGLLNGSLGEATFIHGKNATLVGVDYNGNKYFEDTSKQFGRHRWIMYADVQKQDPITIPPEWHTWLHFISDVAPSTTEIPKPMYELKAWPTVTGTKQAYKPKGDWWNPKARNWQKVEAWKPPQ